MTALKTLTIIKQTLAGWHTRTGGTKKDTKKKRRRAVTPQSPLMSHWKGGMCQLSFVTAHLRFKHCNILPSLDQPLPRGGLTSAFCFQSLQNTKVGRKKKRNTVSRVIVRLHFLGAFKSFHRLTVVFFLLSLCSIHQQQQLVLSKGRHMLDGVKNIRRLYPTNTPVIFSPLFP